jgi:transcriptional regulator with XRE-family HTH domain
MIEYSQTWKFTQPAATSNGNGLRMGWPREITTLRTRLRLSQAEMAQLINVSQSHISRIESGILQPTAEVAARIRELAIDPRTRSVFDDFVSTTQLNPNCSMLLEPQGSVLVAIAASKSLARTVSAGMRLDQIPETAALHTHIFELLDNGFNEGRIASATALWHNTRGRDRYWRMLYAPIRDEANKWYVSATMSELSRTEYDAWLEDHGPKMILEFA